MASSGAAPAGWAAACRVLPRLDLVDELLQRRRETPPERSVGVTDLVDPRSAYWRSIAPVEPSPERRRILEAGREAHVRIGHALAPAKFREVRLRREGIIGQIDLLEEGPVEIKTTTPPADAEALRTSRPAYVEQLGMYCALTGSSGGRLLLVAPGESPAVEAYDGRFASLSAVWQEMRTRATDLRVALERRDPSGLPACPWRGRGCEFEAAKLCSCTGEEKPLGTAIQSELVELVRNPDAANEVRDRLAATANGSPPPARRFRDLLYPRRAYFERTEPEVETVAGTTGLTRPLAPEDLYRGLSDLLESGPPGEMTREPVPSGEPIESVACFRGDPLLLKVTRAWTVLPPARLLAEQPQYFLDLALRCAALGRSRGWLVLGYERAPEWAEKVRVLEVSWDPPGAASELFLDRRESLRRAVTARDPSGLPPCPAWMFSGCPYASRCGCGGPAGASRENR